MKMNCVNCRHAEFRKHPSGRRDLESPGECNYPELMIPNCYADILGGVPQRRYINKYTKGDCSCWEKI